MPTYQQDGATVVEQGRNLVTDGSINNAKQVRDAGHHLLIGAPVKLHRANAERYDIARINKSEKIRELQREIGEIEFLKSSKLLEGEKTGVEVSVADEDADIADLKEKLEKLQRQKIPASDFADRIEREARRFMTGKWKLLSTTYYVGDTRAPIEILKEARGNRTGKERALNTVYKRPRHSEDAIKSGKTCLHRIAKLGEPSVAMLLFGCITDPRTGEFVQNLHPEIEFPEGMTKPSEFHTAVPIHDVLSLMIAKDLPGNEKWITQLIKARADDANAIRDADRPALIAAAKAELLEAQHAEEAANVLCEKMGLMVFRPAEWPVQVMLGVEPDTNTTASQTKNNRAVVPAEANDEPSFEDEGDAGDE